MNDHNQPPVRERGAGFYVRAGWVLTLVGAGSFFLWASLAPLDEGIPVQGTVVVSGKRKAVQSLGAGVMSQILVREGQTVRQGEVLFRLDQTQVEADVQSLRAQYRMAWASQARWQSERDNLARVSFPPELSLDPDPRLALYWRGSSSCSVAGAKPLPVNRPGSRPVSKAQPGNWTVCVVRAAIK